jgi:hypothetical protein
LIGIVAGQLAVAACSPRSELPEALTDHEFWQLFTTLSEPGRSVGLSENIVSNEPRVAENARWITGSGGAYIGVGPEQNFTYIAEIRPRIAFIVDIRRENAVLHLLYKALFELSATRAAFVARLFSRPLASDAVRGGDAADLFAALDQVKPSAALMAQTNAEVRHHLLTTKRMPLEPGDLEVIARVLNAFHDAGPAIHYWDGQSIDRDTLRPSYARLMTMPDMTGQVRSYLNGEGAFAFVRALQQRNLILPVVGDFGGPDALRRIAAYVSERRDVVRAFYGSNVAVYLTNRQMHGFCANLAAMPVARNTSFIDSKSVIRFAKRLESCAPDTAGGRGGR